MKVTRVEREQSCGVRQGGSSARDPFPEIRPGLASQLQGRTAEQCSGLITQTLLNHQRRLGGHNTLWRRPLQAQPVRRDESTPHGVTLVHCGALLRATTHQGALLPEANLSHRKCSCSTTATRRCKVPNRPPARPSAPPGETWLQRVTAL